MIYLDNSATTPPYPEVVDSFSKVSTHYYGNPSSLHQFGMEAENLLTRAREQMAELLGVQSKEIIFTSGGTEGNNLAIKGVAFQYQTRGKHIVTTTIEHDAVHRPLQQLEQLGFDVTYVPVDQHGFVSTEDIESAIRPDTILVSVIHVNNEIGSVQPVIEIGKMLKKHPKVVFHVDHVQGVGKVPLNIREANIHLCTISGHKFHGLKGTGALYIKEGVVLSPLLSGGSQEFQLRSGTENVAGAVALAKALRLTMDHYQKNVHRISAMKEQLIKALEKHDGIVVNTPVEHSAPHIVNITVKGLKAEVFLHSLEKKGIFVSTTSACSSKKKQPSKTLLAMGRSEEEADQAIRISFSYLNIEEDVNYIIQSIFTSIEQLKEVMRDSR
ncbi:cysteine desulfurase family protein [Bacillus songklensis]|uniref:Cysteine desulfurase family protein n=1 Tax=Bacillus songklensis TaxID=1069116 RepID=A0ABV8B236_9BACI